MVECCSVEVVLIYGMKGEAPGSVMQVNFLADILKQVNTGGRQQRPKILECFSYGGHAVQTIVDDDINLSFETLQRAFEWENRRKILTILH